MVTQGSELSQAEQEGLAWIDRLTSGTATDNDMVEMKLWRGQSPAHAKAWSDAVRLRRLMAAHMAEPAEARDAAVSRPVLAAVMSRRAWLGGALAAGAAYAVVRPPLDLWPSLDELRADYRTEAGQRRTVAVASTSVELNTRTALTGHGQGLKLLSGEIAADIVRPLKIEAGQGVIRSDAARLDIRNDGGVVRVACLEGGAMVEHRPSGVTRAVRAGELVRYGARSVETAVSADLARLTAWRQGLVIFHDTPLSEVIMELNRYHAGRIILADGRAGNRRFNGAFKIEAMDEALVQVAAVAGLSRTRLPGGVLLLS